MKWIEDKQMKILQSIKTLFEKETWVYVGMAEAHTQYVQDGKDIHGRTRTTYLLLYVSSKGRRKFEVQGEPHYPDLASKLANKTYANVVAWKNGGPFYNEWKKKDPTPPNNLVVFQGGKK